MSKQAIIDGQKADQILKNPVYKKAMEGMKMRIFDEMRKTGFMQKRKREKLYELLRAADIFEGELNKYLNDMLVEKAKLNQKQPKRIV